MLRTMQVLLLTGSVAFGPTLLAGQHSPYAHHTDRAVTSLSDDDVAALLAGEGAGFALPAELNRYPGPKHVIELADSMQLSRTQRTDVETEFGKMRAAAQRVGRRLVDAERAIDALFALATASEVVVLSHLQAAEAYRTELRSIHLMAHVRTRALLSDAQVATYQRIRGYDEGRS